MDMIKTPHSRGRIYAVALAGMAMVGGILLLAFGAPVLHRMMVKPGAVQMLEIAPFDRVVLIQGPEITRIRVDVIYDRGERQAVGFPEGLAHYVEHLAHFNAADHQDDRAIERHSNAWTTTEATGYFASKPVRIPEEKLERSKNKTLKTTIVTTMKNEGPFILEWLAYHRVIGVDDFLVYTNDCTDGTDTMLDMLQEKGIVQHRDNPFRDSDLKPQHAALQAADDEPVIRNSDWLVCMDVDEFINVKCGDGRLPDLFKSVGDANMISMTWRLFGNNDVRDFKDELMGRGFVFTNPNATSSCGCGSSFSA